MRDEIASDVQKLHEEMAQLRADLSAVTRTLQDIVGRSGDEAASQVRHAAKQAGHTVEQQIEEHPLGSILSSFAVGLAIGLLVSRGGTRT